MADRTDIEWTDATWNPVRGCSRVSAGCQNCYAEGVAARFSGPGLPYEGLIHPKTRGWNGAVRFVPEVLLQPLRWKRARRIFVNSMSDIFHEALRDDEIAAVFGIMAESPQHTFQVLTKRPARMLQWFGKMAQGSPRDRMHEAVKGALGYGHPHRPAVNESNWPLPNVHIGVSVEDQAAADYRIPLLRRVPAFVRLLSMEPLLGAVDFSRVPADPWGRDATPLGGIDWVIVGGESGRGARAMHPAWPRDLRDQCAAAGVPFFFKQWGEWRPICEGGADWFDPLYRSNRKARDGDDQSNLDELYGRRCTVPTLCLQRDGGHCDPLEPMAWGEGAMLAFRIGKKAAGRLLDGVEHNALPGDSRG